MIDFLGQEGAGGTPFPYIESIRISTSDDVSVICRAIRSWFVYRYTEGGKLMYQVDIPLDALPVFEENTVPVLDTVDVDPDEPVLYLMVNYYAPEGDEEGSSDAGLDFFASAIYPFDLSNGSYRRRIDVPKNIIRRQGNGLYDTTEYEVLYELVGVASGGYLFLLSPASAEAYQLIILSPEGAVVGKNLIEITDDEVVYRDMIVTQEGILAAFLGGTESAGLFTWRTDSIVREAYDRSDREALRR